MKKIKLRGLYKKVWGLWSEYIRRRSADWRGDVVCITCSRTFNWKELHAGHYRHGRLDVDPMNINPQCPGCNTYRDGMLNKYALKLIEMYGLNRVKDLEQRADRELGGIKKYTRDYLEKKEQEIKELLKSL